MNYHSNEWINTEIYKHYYEATTLIPSTRIVGVFCQGSQNYGLDYEDSDIDTKCIVTPSFEEISLARKPISTTHIRPNNEHIDLKDIRLYINTFRKQNLNFLEILFTDYKIINPSYEMYWYQLEKNREEITHYDPVRSVKSMMGIASEKYYAMEHRYPSRIEWLDKFGYDPKQLCHLLRVSEYLERYLAGELYKDCLLTKQADYLKAVKVGFHSLEEARTIATETYNNIHKICDDFVESYDKEPDKKVDELFDFVSYEIMKTSVLKEFFVI